MCKIKVKNFKFRENFMNVKIHKRTKKEMRERNSEAKEFFLGENHEEIKKIVSEGFIFAFDELTDEGIKRIQWVPNAQYALIDIFFADYINYIENSGEWTQQEANDIKEIDGHFHELLRDREMFIFKNKKITTIHEAVKEFKKISFFPPKIVIKDGLFIGIEQYFDNVVYF